MALEERFDTSLIAALASREKQIQQTYRPVIGIHKWFARRPGTLFRGLLLAEFANEPLSESFFTGHRFPDKTIVDPFMGGGTPIIEANRLGMKTIGTDINPMAYWVVRQSLSPLDLQLFMAEAERVVRTVESQVGRWYETVCDECGATANVKYFLWVKVYDCEACGEPNDAFPGYMVASNDRHTAFVWYCPECRRLVELPAPPESDGSTPCPHCHSPLRTEPAASRGVFHCQRCRTRNRYPVGEVPRHRLFAMEYHCPHCRGEHKGRYFKIPAPQDLALFEEARAALRQQGDDLIPEDVILEGDETKRLHRWGYRRYRDLFNERQLVGLQALARAIRAVEDAAVRQALATVFSDFLRYQNMLCRYDPSALKCQDIFSVHGFPVGLIQCENNLLGIPGVGSGGFRHFVEKYVRAKEYCQRPFEVGLGRGRQRRLVTEGERIAATFAADVDDLAVKDAYIAARDAATLELPPGGLDGAFTDPPYFDNVQYAELMDFCYVWLRRLLAEEVPEFAKPTTRDPRELTGNVTLGRGVAEFTEGLSNVFQRVATALKPGAPLVFTYHHNRAEAYLPLIVAILDAGLDCTDTLASPAEMSASLHINGTGSSTVDSIFVCRKAAPAHLLGRRRLPQCLQDDVEALRRGGVRLTAGDVVCMALGHLTRLAIESLAATWDRSRRVEDKLTFAQAELERWLERYPPAAFVEQLLRPSESKVTVQYALSV
ncbi:MAG TPA: hypothetical protein VIK98_07770 [Limnochordales bacterium]